jgi:MSHA pilin protein MshA
MIKKYQRGFTLIELVVVIVILGILAAFAVPRFMGMEAEARAATIKSMGGTLRAAASMAHSKCQAQGCGATGNVTFEGQTVTMAFGYPNAATIRRTLQDVSGFAVSNPTPTQTRFAKIGATGNCWVQYNQPTNANGPTYTYGNGGNVNTIGTAPWNASLAAQCE